MGFLCKYYILLFTFFTIISYSCGTDVHESNNEIEMREMLGQMDTAMESLYEVVKKQNEEIQHLKYFQTNFSPVRGCGQGPWISSISNMKCYKFINQSVTHDVANSLCKVDVGVDGAIPEILKIDSRQEQDFLITNVLDAVDVKSSVWLNQNSSIVNIIQQTDNSTIGLSDLNTNNSTNKPQRKCLEFTKNVSSDDNNFTPIGTWTDVDCTKTNMVICQKSRTQSTWEIQQYSENLYKELLETKLDLSKTLKTLTTVQQKSSLTEQTLLSTQKKLLDTQNTVQQLKTNLLQIQNEMLKSSNVVSTVQQKLLMTEQSLSSVQNNIKNNPIPIGFIYVQFPNQAEPLSIWPGIVWEDISNKYAGYFFRALGGGSSSFGSTQSENAPRLTSVSSQLMGARGNDHKYVSVPSGGQSSGIWTGDDRPGWYELIQTFFTNSGGEVRPKNMAIKIWKRKN